MRFGCGVGWHGGMRWGEAVILVVIMFSVLDYKYMSIWNMFLESGHLDFSDCIF